MSAPAHSGRKLPSQKEINEFVLDLIEFLGKHFTGYFDKTKVVGGNEGLSLLIKNAGSGSELEIATDGARVVFRMGDVVRPYDRSEKEKLFATVLSDLIAMLSGESLAIAGYKEEKVLAGRFYRGGTEAEAKADFASRYPDCERFSVMKWGVGALEKSPAPAEPS